MTGGNQAGVTSVEGADQPDPRGAAETGLVEPGNSTVAMSSDSGKRHHAGRHGLPSSAIHELRTPLTSIHGYAQVLQRILKSEPRAFNATTVIARESVRLTEMLSLLSELSDLESESAEERSRVEVREIAAEAADNVRRRDGAAHPIEVTGSAPALCVPAQLGHALTHILTNAVRYSDAGLPVSVSISQSGESVRIAVKDQGIGIFPEDATSIYRIFERGANARQAGIRGLGLGLYLAQQAVEQCGGSLSHAPAVPEGTEFSITLPSA